MSWMFEGVTGPDRPAPCCCPLAPCGAVQWSTQGGILIHTYAQMHVYIYVSLPVLPKQVSKSGLSRRALEHVTLTLEAWSVAQRR